MSELSGAVVPNLLGSRAWSHGRQFFPQTRGWEDGFRMIQVHYIYCALYFIALFLPMLGLHSCAGFPLVWESRGYSLVAVCGLLIAVASLVVDLGCLGFSSCGTWAQYLWLPGSRAQAQ